MKRSVIIIICCFLLSGCAGVSFVLSGANLINDRHYVSSVLKDQNISYEAYDAISNSPEFIDRSNISVATHNSIVLLTGHTRSWKLWKKARKKIAKIPGVRHIYNYIKVKKNSPKLNYLSDSWITAKIRTKIIANLDVDPRKVKIVTHSGTVYLMGCMQRKEASIIVEMAKNTDGVKHVKTLFEYIVIVRS